MKCSNHKTYNITYYLLTLRFLTALSTTSSTPGHAMKFTLLEFTGNGNSRMNGFLAERVGRVR